MEAFTGCKWQFVSSENFDEYMKAVGIGFVTRKAGNVAKPDVFIEQKGDKWVIRSQSTFKNTSLEFELDKEFEETTPDGRKCMTTITFVDGKLIQKQNCTPPSELIRELDADGQLLVTCKCGDVVCTRKYKKVEL